MSTLMAMSVGSFSKTLEGKKKHTWQRPASGRAFKHILTAVIYDKRDRVLSIGKNSYVRTHPVQAALARAHGTPEKIYIQASGIEVIEWSS